MSDEEKDNIVIRKLVPNAIIVPVDGRDVIVPTDRGENARMNMMVASVMRSLLMENIKNYKEKEVTLTPRELADLAKALKDINSASLEIYSAAESKANPLEGIKVADNPQSAKPLSFDKIKKPTTIEVKADNA